MTRMATSSNSDEWTKENIGNFSPKTILDYIETQNLHYDSTKLDCEFCNQFLAMSGINYSNGKETIGQMIKNISIGLLVILVLYFIFK
jgi:hypothetical protein